MLSHKKAYYITYIIYILKIYLISLYLKTIQIINIPKNVIIDNLFKQNNTILKHFKLMLLDKKQGKHIIKYLIKNQKKD